MVLYDPIFGIRFLPEILTTVGRIHISRKKHTGETDVLDLDSDAEHQSEKSEHPVQLKSTGIRFLQEKLGVSNYSVLVQVMEWTASSDHWKYRWDIPIRRTKEVVL